MGGVVGGSGIQPSNVPDHRLVEVVSGPGRIAAGRALDVGSGTGRNAIYLASVGWETVGVEIVGRYIERARHAVGQNGLPLRFVHGDVTRLDELDLGGSFDLLVDGGCYHMIPRSQRQGYVDSVTKVAAPGALLILVGFTRHLGNLTQDELVQQFSGWTLLAARRIPGSQMSQYLQRPALLRAALARGLGQPWRFEFSRARG
jgi:SAM-dependent methyltransferase